MPYLRYLLLSAYGLLSNVAIAAITPDKVEIPAAHIPAPLIGFLYSPNTPGAHPAVVMLHGCGGAYDGKGQPNARHRMWGEWLAQHGYQALLVDSLSPRGIKELCTIPFKNRPIKESDRVTDAYTALNWLQTRTPAAPKVALLGWSHGGGVTLDSITHPPAASAARFSAAISFYPGCSTRVAHADRFHPYAPLLLMIGEADDWTPAAPCKALAAAVSARQGSMQIITWPDTYHDFDNPALSAPRVRKEVPNGVNPGHGVTVAPNPAARKEAKQHVLDFLAKTFQ